MDGFLSIKFSNSNISELETSNFEKSPQAYQSQAGEEGSVGRGNIDNGHSKDGGMNVYTITQF